MKRLEADQILTQFRTRLALRYHGEKYFEMVGTLDYMCGAYGEIDMAALIQLDMNEAELALHHYLEKNKDKIFKAETEPEEELTNGKRPRFRKAYPRQRSIAKRLIALVIAGIVALVLMTAALSQMSIAHSDDVIARADQILEVYGK